MTELDTHSGPLQYLSILRKHVLEPVLAAESLAERERVEVAHERDAFEQFAERVADVSPVSPQQPALLAGTVVDSTSAGELDALRQAYVDTVMAVPHYDDVYGESVEENAVAEFGPEVACLLQPQRTRSFTKHQKQAVIAAAEKSAAERDEFCDTLDTESASLESMQHDLTTVLDTLDSSTVPAWYHQQFEDDLTRIVRERQSTLGFRSSMSYLDGHSLCEYLYDDEPWRYPVLTAVARLLDAVTVRD